MIAEQVGYAGFRGISIETVERQSHAPSARDLAIGFCQGSPLRSEIEARDATRLGEATDAATQALLARFGSGPIVGKMRAHVISAANIDRKAAAFQRDEPPPVGGFCYAMGPD